MEGKNSKPEEKSSSSTHRVTAESKKPEAATTTFAGSPSDGKRSGSGDGAGELPAWKLDCLCRESGGMSAAVISGGFPCF
uniref:Uncharacterized protein n=1 Tax=Leersia perrieri TaxID=77586 RepID=A0A0D9WDZ7_9ORYZ